MRRAFVISICCLAILVIACSKRKSQAKIVVDIPAGFTGNFVLEMGMKNASALPKNGDQFVVEIPSSGKLETSTLVEKPKVIFKNGSQGNVWGYSDAVFTTGDGIPVGEKIEFFVGTKKEYEANENKKNHSHTAPEELEADFARV